MCIGFRSYWLSVESLVFPHVSHTLLSEIEKHAKSQGVVKDDSFELFFQF